MNVLWELQASNTGVRFLQCQNGTGALSSGKPSRNVKRTKIWLSNITRNNS